MRCCSEVRFVYVNGCHATFHIAYRRCSHLPSLGLALRLYVDEALKHVTHFQRLSQPQGINIYRLIPMLLGDTRAILQPVTTRQTSVQNYAQIC